MKGQINKTPLHFGPFQATTLADIGTILLKGLVQNRDEQNGRRATPRRCFREGLEDKKLAFAALSRSKIEQLPQFVNDQ